MTKFSCLDNQELYFHGTLTSPVHSYLHIELLECEQEVLNQTPGYENATCATDQELAFYFATHILVGYTTNTFVNKTEFENNPVSTLNDAIFYLQLDQT